MSYYNVPDDWGMYYYNCSLCGGKYHASEGGCYCTEDMELCVGFNCGDALDLDSYHDVDDVRKLGDGKYYCDDCLVCECCDDDGKTDPTVHYSEDHGLLLCGPCDTGEGCADRCVKETATG